MQPLFKDREKYGAALKELCDKYKVNKEYPAKLVARLKETEALVTRSASASAAHHR